MIFVIFAQHFCCFIFGNLVSNQNIMEKIEIREEVKVIVANTAMLNDSTFRDVAMMNVKIVDANLSDLEIEGAQLGGAYIHNIGMPPKGHPHHNEGVTMRPVKFADCYLAGSKFS